MKHKHIKTGDYYTLIHPSVINCTNAQEEQRMAMYIKTSPFSPIVSLLLRILLPNLVFVRENAEFQEKFEAV